MTTRRHNLQVLYYSDIQAIWCLQQKGDDSAFAAFILRQLGVAAVTGSPARDRGIADAFKVCTSCSRH